MWKFFPTAATLAGIPQVQRQARGLRRPGRSRSAHDALDAFNQELVTKIDKIQALAGEPGPALHDGRRPRPGVHQVREHPPLGIQSALLQRHLPPERPEPPRQGRRPLDARIKSATERAKLLPGPDQEGQGEPEDPRPDLHRSGHQADARDHRFLQDRSSPALAADAAAKNGFQAEIAKAVAALEDYQRFLKNELLPKSTGNFRLGADTHLRLLRMTSQGNIPIEELVARANADFKNIRREMFLVCIPFYKIMYPNINIEQLTTQRARKRSGTSSSRACSTRSRATTSAATSSSASIAASARQHQGVHRPDEALRRPRRRARRRAHAGRSGRGRLDPSGRPGRLRARTAAYTLPGHAHPRRLDERAGERPSSKSTTTSTWIS